MTDDIPQFHYKLPVVPPELQHLPNRISETFSGKTLFITGGSGFLGKVLIEKILRKCPSVGRIYLLLRPKKGKDGKQRLEEIFKSVAFSEVRKLHGQEAFKKVTVIPGDASELGLGLSDKDRQLLQNETQIVIHAAATIRFDEPLKKAVILNTRGTHQMLQLATEMTKLELFVHISTAYCHLDQKVLEEKAYPSPVDPYKIIKSCELMEEDLVDKVGEKIMKGFPNSYAFTKNLSESIVFEYLDKGLPILVLRPSIVIPTWQEPLPGWTDNINGPTGLLIGAGKGVIRTMYCDNNGYADYIPVDICVNAIMSIIWNYLGEGVKSQNVYNLTSNSEWQVTWQQVIDIGRDIITNDVPLNNAVWYPGGSMKRSRLVHNICVFFFHMLPAYFLDSLIFLSGNKPVLLRVQDRISKGFEVFEYYANNQWDFKNDCARSIRNKMNPREKIEYKVEGEGMDIRLYFRDCILAARIYILKEAPETIPSARRHMRMMFWVDVIARLAFTAFVIWALASWFSPIRELLVGLFSMIEGLLSTVLPKSALKYVKYDVVS